MKLSTKLKSLFGVSSKCPIHTKGGEGSGCRGSSCGRPRGSGNKPKDKPKRKPKDKPKKNKLEIPEIDASDINKVLNETQSVFSKVKSQNLKNALTHWSGYGYKEIRAVERGRTNYRSGEDVVPLTARDKEWAEKSLKNLNDEFDTLPDYKGKILRGVDGELSVKKGQDFTLDAYSSFSAKTNIDGTNFTSSDNILIVKNNKNGKSIWGLSAHPEELEVLVPKGTKYKIESIEISKNPMADRQQKIIYLEEVSSKSADISAEINDALDAPLFPRKEEQDSKKSFIKKLQIVLKGGPGSGCRGENCGRPRGSLSDKPEKTNKETKKTRSNIVNAAKKQNKDATRIKWDGIDKAIKDGTPITRDFLLKVERPNFLDNVTEQNYEQMLIAHTVMSNFPNNIRSLVDGKATIDERNYYSAYMKLKSDLEDAAKTNTVSEMLANSRQAVRDALKSDAFKDRVTEYNELVKINNNLLDPYSRKAGGIGEAFALVAKYGGDEKSAQMDIVAKVLDGQTIKEATGGGNLRGFSPTAFSQGKPVRVSDDNSLSSTTAQMDYIKNKVKADITFASKVNDEERTYHTEQIANGLLDLSRVTGLSPSQISHGGALKIASAVTDKKRAFASYDHRDSTIYLTRTGGAGSLAHEWGHFLDNKLYSTALGKEISSAYLTNGVPDTYHDKFEPKVIESIKKLNSELSVVRDRMRKDLTTIGITSKHKNYLLDRREVFARSFETWVSHKLGVAGEKNTYLVGTGADKYMTKLESDAKYPTDKEIKDLDKHFSEFFSALKDSKIAKKMFPSETEPSFLSQLKHALCPNSSPYQPSISPKAFDPSQPRDESGRWTSDGGAGATSRQHSSQDTDYHADQGEVTRKEGVYERPHITKLAPNEIPVHEATNNFAHGAHMAITSDKVFHEVKGKDITISSAANLTRVANAEIVTNVAKKADEFAKALNKEGIETGAPKVRAKEPASLQEKMNTKWENKTLNQVTDGIGIRYLFKNQEQLDKAVIKSGRLLGMKVLEHKDHNKDDGYSATHLLVRTPGGMIAEVQFKTQNQQAWSSWNDDGIYKPPKKEGKKDFTGNKEVHRYAAKVAKYLKEVDRGKIPSSPRPEAPAELKKANMEFPWENVNMRPYDK